MMSNGLTAAGQGENPRERPAPCRGQSQLTDINVNVDVDVDVVEDFGDDDERNAGPRREIEPRLSEKRPCRKREVKRGATTDVRDLDFDSRDGELCNITTRGALAWASDGIESGRLLTGDTSGDFFTCGDLFTCGIGIIRWRAARKAVSTSSPTRTHQA